MLNRLFKRKRKRKRKAEKPDVYLGVVAVAPRSDFKRHLESWVFSNRPVNADDALRDEINEIFQLPLVSERQSNNATDLGIEIIVPKYQSGELFDVVQGDSMLIPIVWRPKLTIAGRLYTLQNQQTIHTETVSVKMSWGAFVNRVLSLRAFIPWEPLFDESDLKYLLNLACLELIDRMRSKV